MGVRERCQQPAEIKLTEYFSAMVPNKFAITLELSFTSAGNLGCVTEFAILI